MAIRVTYVPLEYSATVNMIDTLVSVLCEKMQSIVYFATTRRCAAKMSLRVAAGIDKFLSEQPEIGQSIRWVQRNQDKLAIDIGGDRYSIEFYSICSPDTTRGISCNSCDYFIERVPDMAKPHMDRLKEEVLHPILDMMGVIEV